MDVLRWLGEHPFLSVILVYMILQSVIWICVAPFKYRHCSCCRRREAS